MSGRDKARRLLATLRSDATPPGPETAGPRASYDRPVKLATVDTSYAGNGLPKVLFDGETVMGTRGYAWDSGGNYSPFPGQRVYMVPIGRGYIIAGPVAQSLGPRLFDLRPTVAATGKLSGYSITTPSDLTIYAPPHGWRLVSGECMLFGTMKPKVNLTGGEILLTLPPEMWPLDRKIWFAEFNGSAARLEVWTDGTLRVRAGQAIASGTYVDFSGIRWNNNPSLARTAMTLVSPFAPYDGTFYRPKYAASDGYGRRLWEGVVKSGAPGANIALTTANPGIVGSGVSHLYLATDDGGGNFARMDAPPTAAGTSLLRGNPGAATVTAMSLEQAVMTDAIYATAQDVYYSNGSNYAAPWANVRIAKLADGSIKMTGLGVANGSGNFIQIPREWAPKHHHLFVVESVDTVGRIDLDPAGTISTGAASGFISFETLQWMPADAWDHYWPTAVPV